MACGGQRCSGMGGGETPCLASKLGCHLLGPQMN